MRGTAPIFKSILCFFLLALITCTLHAQERNTGNTKQDNAYTAVDGCSDCDSLGDAYLNAGDTSMAIHYYQMYVDHHSDEPERKKPLAKLRKLYIHRSRSFYLIDQ